MSTCGRVRGNEAFTADSGAIHTVRRLALENFCLVLNFIIRAGEMAQGLRVLAAQSWGPEFRSQHPQHL